MYPARLTITNTIGQVLAQENIIGENSKNKVNTTGFPNGIYIVKLYLINGEVKSRKIIIQH